MTAPLPPQRASLRELVRNEGNEWRLLRRLLRGSRRWTVTLSLAAILTGFCEAAVLALVAESAGAMVLGHEVISSKLGPVHLHLGIGTALLAALVAALLRAALSVGSSWLAAQVAAYALETLRTEVLNAYTAASWAAQAEAGEGHVQELMTNQINQAVSSLNNLGGALSAAAMFLTLSLSSLVVNPMVAGIIVGTAVVLFFALQPLNRLGRAAAREFSAVNMEYAHAVSETVSISEEMHVFGVVEPVRQRLGRLVRRSREIFARGIVMVRLAGSIYTSLVLLLVVAGLAALHLAGERRLTALGAIVLMLVRASGYAQSFQGSYISVLQTMPFLKRLDQAIGRYRHSTPQPGTQPMPTLDSLQFFRVCYSYGRQQRALDDVTFSVIAGEAIGVVGPTGAGKSTLTQVLLRLREPDAGLFLVNDLSVRNIRFEDWQQRVSYVPQDPRLLQATVADNIRFYRDIPDAVVVDAAQRAHIHDEILAMPQGYQTVVGQRASAVSGGQRQRICIARALAGDPEMLILDEPTSALDASSEAAIRASLAQLRGTTTLFIVAHRLSTLGICDRVLVLEHGQVQAFGSPAELRLTSGFYQRATALLREPG
jgi:ATP-binding cassette subfamily B protein